MMPRRLHATTGFLLLGLAAPTLADPLVVHDWRSLVAVAGAPVGSVIGDFDDDAQREVVTLVELPNRTAFRRRHALYVHQPGTHPSEWDVVDALELDQQAEAAPVVLERAGADAVVVKVSRQDPDTGFLYFENRTYSGNPLRLERVAPGYPWTELVYAGDVDADGVEDVVEFDSPVLTVRSLLDGTVRQSWTLALSTAVVVGQLDVDPALELAVQSNVVTVLDAATGATQWISPASASTAWIGDVRSGRSANELLTAAGSTVTVRSAGSFVEQFNFPLPSAWSHQLADLDQDGYDEFISLATPQASVRDLEAQTQRSFPLASAFGRFAFDSLDADADLELISWYQFAQRHPVSTVFDTTSGAREGVTPGAQPAQFAIVRADLDADRRDELVSIIASELDEESRLQVRDAETGALLRVAAIPRIWPTFQGLATSNLVVAQMDGDAAREIVFMHYGGDRLAVMDGVTLAVQWSRIPRDADQNAVVLRHIDVADVDGDGENEVVALAREPRLYVFDGSSGLLEWKSEPLGTSEGAFEAIAATADRAGGTTRILVWTGNRMHAFDGRSRALLWQRSYGWGPAHFERTSSVQCAFLLRFDAQVRRVPCHAPESIRVLPWDGDAIEWIEPIGGRYGGYLLLMDGELVHAEARDFELEALGVTVGVPAYDTSVGGVALRPARAGAIRVHTAFDAILHGHSIAVDELFGDGFD
jgi:hypothetical protein